MSNHLLEKQIKEIQEQYFDLLKKILPLLESELYLLSALDSISLFWRKKQSVIEMFLNYIVKERNTVFYTGAVCFEENNGDQYPFMLMGDLHIFDDPLGRYCEICHQNESTLGLFLKQILLCARNNIDILKNCDELIIVLPLRNIEHTDQAEDLKKLGEKCFLNFFNDFYDLNSYFQNCNTVDDLVKHFRLELQGVVCLYENDNAEDVFRTRVERVIEISKNYYENGHSIAEYFYFFFFSTLLQSIEILSIASFYNATPLIRYPVALQNAFLLLPSFYKDNLYQATSRFFILNSLYKLFVNSFNNNVSLRAFYENVKNFSFEKKALSCYSENTPKETMKKLDLLIESFVKNFSYQDK